MKSPLKVTVSITANKGAKIQEAVDQASEIARAARQPVNFEFNCLQVEVSPDASPADVVADFFDRAGVHQAR